jgi:hypothetical protein
MLLLRIATSDHNHDRCEGKSDFSEEKLGDRISRSSIAVSSRGGAIEIYIICWAALNTECEIEDLPTLNKIS